MRHAEREKRKREIKGDVCQAEKRGVLILKEPELSGGCLLELRLYCSKM
jgi:hypothetical protein